MDDLDLMMDRSRTLSHTGSFADRTELLRVVCADVYREFELEMTDESRKSLEAVADAFLKDAGRPLESIDPEVANVVGDNRAMLGFTVLIVEEMKKEDDEELNSGRSLLTSTEGGNPEMENTASGKPVVIRLDKEYGRRLLDILANGGPIESTDAEGTWSVADMLAVAGVCVFGAWSHGPSFPQPDLSEGQREVENEGHIDSVVNAADFLSRVFSQLQDDQWEFGETLAAVVFGHEVRVNPI